MLIHAFPTRIDPIDAALHKKNLKALPAHTTTARRCLCRPDLLLFARAVFDSYVCPVLCVLIDLVLFSLLTASNTRNVKNEIERGAMVESVCDFVTLSFMTALC